MRWVFLLLLAANIAFALAVQIKSGGEPQYARLELNSKKIQLITQ